MEKEVLLTKEEFVNIIKRLESSYDLICQYMDDVEKNRILIPDQLITAFSQEPLVVKLLEKIMKDDEEFISYFVYELNYGRDYTTGLVTDRDGVVNIASAENLYEYLIKEMKNRCV